MLVKTIRGEELVFFPRISVLYNTDNVIYSIYWILWLTDITVEF
jgi:hypothetical protein